MSLKNRRLLRLVIILSGLHAGIPGCSGPAEFVPAQEEPAASAPSDLVRVDPTAVQTGSLELGRAKVLKVPETVRVTGRVGFNENRTVHIGSIVEGRLTRILTMVGDSVEQGQILAYLHSVEVHESRADYAQAMAEKQRAETELEYARTVRDRANRLYQLRAGSLAQKERAEADYRSAEVNLKRAQAEIGRIEEHLSHMGVSAEGATEEYTEHSVREAGTYEEEELVPVVSPQRGTLLQTRVTLGTVVTPSDHLFLVSDLRTLWVHAEVPERYLGSLRKGQPVTLTVQAYGDEEFPARVSRIADEMNPETRTVHVICEVANPDQRLKAEMYAGIAFETSEGRDTLAVPFEAVQTLEDRQVVFVEQADGRFQARDVATGRRIDSQLEILKGLGTGERIVVRGSFLLKSEMMRSQIEE